MTIDQKLEELATRLRKFTESGHLAWKPVGVDCFETSVAGHPIRIQEWAGNTNMIVYASEWGGDRQVLETYSNVAHVKFLFKAARKRALRSDEAVETLLKHLEAAEKKGYV